MIWSVEMFIKTYFPGQPIGDSQLLKVVKLVKSLHWQTIVIIWWARKANFGASSLPELEAPERGLGTCICRTLIRWFRWLARFGNPYLKPWEIPSHPKAPARALHSRNVSRLLGRNSPTHMGKKYRVNKLKQTNKQKCQFKHLIHTVF